MLYKVEKIGCKGNKKRVQNKMNPFISFAEDASCLGFPEIKGYYLCGGYLARVLTCTKKYGLMHRRRAEGCRVI